MVNRALNAALADRGWSTHDLARESTVSQPTCWRAVAGRRLCRRNRLLIAAALGVPAIDVFPDDP